jgi:hypothetical protein
MLFNLSLSWLALQIHIHKHKVFLLAPRTHQQLIFLFLAFKKDPVELSPRSVFISNNLAQN